MTQFKYLDCIQYKFRKEMHFGECRMQKLNKVEAKSQTSANNILTKFAVEHAITNAPSNELTV